MSSSAGSPSTTTCARTRGRATGFSVASEADSADLRRLTVTSPGELAEPVRAVLAEIVPSGWSEEQADDGRWAFTAWVPRRLATAHDALRAALEPLGTAVTVGARDEGDEWRDGLQRHHRPVDVRGRIRIRPPWEPAVPGPVDIVIDPGMAFGTGQHATTVGCLDLLLDVPPGSALDVGCGTGILAIAAAKLGHRPVHGVDNDPLAVEAAARNAEENGAQVTVSPAEGGRDALPPADLVLANLTRLHVAALAGALGDCPPRRAILSGFVPDDTGSATAPWLALGFRSVRTAGDGRWAAVLLERA